MRRLLLVVLILVGLLVGLASFVDEAERTAIHAWLMDPVPPPVPDYADERTWAALPTTKDAADRALVPGAADQQATAAADVFFLYAGSNWSLHWNAPIDHWLVKFLVDGALIEQWASAFNGCCRVYVPRYRQEAIGYPHDHVAEHERSIAIAAEDVRAAFRHYMTHYNGGRPFIIAGAQSGGRHALQLLIDEVVGKPIRRQLIAAYIAGAHVDAAARQALGDIRVCGAATETGCISAWSATGRQAEKVESRVGDMCVNPLTWRADEAHAPKELNLGTIGGRLWGSGGGQFDSGLVDAQCKDGWLWVTPPEGRWFWQPGGPGDYHIQNYTFFFANIRDNAIERVRAFGANHALSPTTAESPSS